MIHLLNCVSILFGPYAYILHIDMSAEIGLTDYGQYLSICDSVTHVCRHQFKSKFLLHSLAGEIHTHTLFCMGAD
jgi:hypothetical protein